MCQVDFGPRRCRYPALVQIQRVQEGLGIGFERSFTVPLLIWDLQAFMNAVAEQCKARNHHPEWSNVRYVPEPCAASLFP